MRSHQETTQACTLDMIVGAMNITNIGRSLQVSMGLSWVFFVFVLSLIPLQRAHNVYSQL